MCKSIFLISRLEILVLFSWCASFLSNFQMGVQTDDSRVIKGGKKANSSCCTGWHFHAPNIVTQKLLGDKRKFDQ